jgi:hypothetical protein
MARCAGFFGNRAWLGSTLADLRDRSLPSAVFLWCSGSVALALFFLVHAHACWAS